jgi:hypothetical protein
MAKPTFLGLGAQKCASSWIHKVLEDHSEVFVSQPKELDFFTHYFNRGYTWYERHFDQASEVKAIGEISPSYFCDPLAPERVRRYRPDLKLVLLLRDPLRRAFSNHLHELRKGHFHGVDLSFEAGLASNPMYLFQSRYGTHLGNWLRAFPSEQMLLLLQEEIEADPLTQVRRLYAFLGVDPDHRSADLFRRSHESIDARSRTVFRAWRAVGDFGRRHRLGPVVEAVKRLPPVAAAMRANRLDLRAEIPPMRPETEVALQRELAPELIQLAALTGRDDWPWATWRAVQTGAAARGRAGVLS